MIRQPRTVRSMRILDVLRTHSATKNTKEHERPKDVCLRLPFAPFVVN